MDKFFESAQKQQQSRNGDKDSAGDDVAEGKKTLPRGVVLGKDGKP